MEAIPLILINECRSLALRFGWTGRLFARVIPPILFIIPVYIVLSIGCLVGHLALRSFPAERCLFYTYLMPAVLWIILAVVRRRWSYLDEESGIQITSLLFPFPPFGLFLEHRIKDTSTGTSVSLFCDVWQRQLKVENASDSFILSVQDERSAHLLVAPQRNGKVLLKEAELILGNTDDGRNEREGILGELQVSESVARSEDNPFVLHA